MRSLDVPVQASVIRMKFTINILPAILFVFHLGMVGCCVGGRSYPAQVAQDTMHLTKKPIPDGIVYQRSEFPDYKKWMDLLKVRREEYGHTYAGIYHNGEVIHFKFCNKSYVLLSKGSQLYIYCESKRVWSRKLPRYMHWAKVRSICFSGKEYLVIYVDQQTTSNTSTLLVLDEKLSVQYQEHFMGALALGTGVSDEYGEFFVIEAGYEKSKKVSLQALNVGYLYYLPGR